AGHESVMGEAGIRPWTVLKPSGYEGGELAVGELLSGQTLPTAVLAESDDMALGVHRALRRSGIAIPDAISLMGFGNRDVTEVLDLTTVDQAPRDIGVEAGLLTADILEETRPFDTHVELPTQIIPRRSTAAPKETRESSSGVEPTPRGKACSSGGVTQSCTRSTRVASPTATVTASATSRASPAVWTTSPLWG